MFNLEERVAKVTKDWQSGKLWTCEFHVSAITCHKLDISEQIDL